MILYTVLALVTDGAAYLLGHASFRRHFHLMLSALVLLGPALSLWASQHSVFANKRHYLYRAFLSSGCGWTCVLCGSFVLLLSYSCRGRPSLSLRHLSRLAVAAALWWGVRRGLAVLENATGSCYQPLAPPSSSDPAASSLAGLGLGSDFRSSSAAPQPEPPTLLLLREGQGKAGCVGAGLQWRGYEVSDETFLLVLCCLLLAEEMAVFAPYLALAGGRAGPERDGAAVGSPVARVWSALGSVGVCGPLRLLFLLCVTLLLLWLFLLLCLLAYRPSFPSQLLGGALGCLAWRALYQGWFRQTPGWLCPGRPGVGLFIPD
ncbi:fat storage-inducing transmembrane protein 1 [Amia ocellicauda]|uniref:fat storage-inducing transmembrane protein 1 n=1 Tax=Amia ocellicauda TaxID=2972642 RepID=UPI003464738D